MSVYDTIHRYGKMPVNKCNDSGNVTSATDTYICSSNETSTPSVNVIVGVRHVI